MYVLFKNKSYWNILVQFLCILLFCDPAIFNIFNLKKQNKTKNKTKLNFQLLYAPISIKLEPLFRIINKLTKNI